MKKDEAEKVDSPAEERREDYQAESDLRALIEAEKIKNDPKRLRAAIAKRDELKGHLKNVRSANT